METDKSALVHPRVHVPRCVSQVHSIARIDVPRCSQLSGDNEIVHARSALVIASVKGSALKLSNTSLIVMIPPLRGL